MRYLGSVGFGHHARRLQQRRHLHNTAALAPAFERLASDAGVALDEVHRHWEWASAVIGSRSWGNLENGHADLANLLPGIDMINHHDDATVRGALETGDLTAAAAAAAHHHHPSPTSRHRCRPDLLPPTPARAC